MKKFFSVLLFLFCLFPMCSFTFDWTKIDQGMMTLDSNLQQLQSENNLLKIELESSKKELQQLKKEQSEQMNSYLTLSQQFEDYQKQLQSAKTTSKIWRTSSIVLGSALTTIVIVAIATKVSE